MERKYVYRRLREIGFNEDDSRDYISRAFSFSERFKSKDLGLILSVKDYYKGITSETETREEIKKLFPEKKYSKNFIS